MTMSLSDMETSWVRDGSRSGPGSSYSVCTGALYYIYISRWAGGAPLTSVILLYYLYNTHMRTRQNIWCQYNNNIIPIWKPSQNIWFTLASDIFKTLSANALKTLASNLVTRLVIIPSVYHNNVGIWYRSNIGAMSGQCCYEVWPTRLCYLGRGSRRAEKNVDGRKSGTEIDFQLRGRGVIRGR